MPRLLGGSAYAKPWRQAQLCLVPMEAFYEPRRDAGKHERWRIGMADDSTFAVAGLWRPWDVPDGGISHSFTQITINADIHPLMKSFHKPEYEKWSLVIVPVSEYDDWLECTDPEHTRSCSYLRLYPASAIAADNWRQSARRTCRSVAKSRCLRIWANCRGVKARDVCRPTRARHNPRYLVFHSSSA